MAIDIRKEPLIRLADVPKVKWLPKRRGGRRLNQSTVFRWAQHGLNGVRLEVVKAGGAMATSEAALERFFHRLSSPSADAPVVDVASGHREAERALAAAGI